MLVLPALVSFVSIAFAAQTIDPSTVDIATRGEDNTLAHILSSSDSLANPPDRNMVQQPKGVLPFDL